MRSRAAGSGAHLVRQPMGLTLSLHPVAAADLGEHADALLHRQQQDLLVAVALTVGESVRAVEAAARQPEQIHSEAPLDVRAGLPLAREPRLLNVSVGSHSAPSPSMASSGRS